MTIAFGMLVSDGLLLCADTLYTDGYIKEYHDKIFSYSGKRAVIGFALAGNAAIGRMAVDDCIAALSSVKQEALSARDAILEMRPVIERIYKAHVETKASAERDIAEFSVIVGIATPTEEKLYTSMGAVLCPMNKFDCIGIGREIGLHLIGRGYRSSLFVDEATILALQVLAAAKERMDGVGGDSRFLAIRNKKASTIVAHDVNRSESFIKAYESRAMDLLFALGDPNSNPDQFREQAKRFKDYAEDLQKEWAVRAAPWIELRDALLH